jgi:hypothetical protein
MSISERRIRARQSAGANAPDNTCSLATVHSSMIWMCILALLVPFAVVTGQDASRSRTERPRSQADRVHADRAAAYDVCSDDGRCTHEEMAEYAGQVYSANSDDPEFNIAKVMEGAGHEDELDHIYGWNTSPVPGAVTFTHFWDADSGAGAMSDVDGPAAAFGPFHNSWHKVNQYWSMALGEYTNGNNDLAYHFLGHVAHQFGDNTIPTHVHVSAHDPFSGDDSFEDWMSQGASHGDFPDQPPGNDLTAAELAELSAPTYVPSAGGHDPLIMADLNVDIQEVAGATETSLQKLYWLLYTTNQVADFFPSDRASGDSVDPEGWVQTELANMAAITSPRTVEDLEDNDCVDLVGSCLGGTINDYDNNYLDNDLGVIREYSYLRGIRAMAGLYQLFNQTVNTAPIVVVTIERVEELVGCSVINEDCDFYSRVSIDNFTGRNEGDECFDCISQYGSNFFPDWAWGKVVGTSGTIPLKIEILDDDNAFEDGLVKIKHEAGTALNLTLDLAKCLAGEAGAITGDGIPGGVGSCNQSLVTNASADDEDVDDQGIARVTFSVKMSNVPPTADAGGPYFAECDGVATDVQLDGTGSFDPNNDPLAYLWTTDCPGGSFDDDTSATPILTVDSVAPCPLECDVFLTVDDGNGGADSDTAMVTVEDTTDPDITCAADVTVTCGEPTDPSATGSSTAVDDCDAVPEIASDDVVIPTTCPADPIQEVIERSWTAVDDCGLESSCVQEITVLKLVLSLDIKPGSCPNGFNPNSGGVLPISLLGTDTFDVSTVDLSTVLISRADCPTDAVTPIRSRFEDAGTPFDGTPCDCHTLTGDGLTDLSLTFKKRDVVQALGLEGMVAGDSVELILSGELNDGCSFIASDCVTRPGGQ